MRTYFLIYLLFPIILNAQFTVAPYFSDNMVLQRDQPIHIWGKASPGKKISVSLLNQKKATIVQSDSSWDIYLKPIRANSHPSILIVQSGAVKKIYENVLIGDVWLCIGQSNMLFSMREEMHYQAEVKNGKQPLLRFYNPTYIGKDVYNQLFSDSMLQRLNQDNFYSQASWNQSDSQYFAKMERRMMFLVKAAGQEDFELYTQLLGTGWMIRNATVFTQWNKNPSDIISLLMWVRSEL